MSKALFEIRRVDAMREAGPEGCGWTWNQSFHIDEVETNFYDMTTRQILSWLRKNGYLTQASIGTVFLHFDGDMYEVKIRSTKEPVLAIMPLR